MGAKPCLESSREMNLQNRQFSFDDCEPSAVPYAVFHDESGTYSPSSPDRWLFHGAMFLPSSRISKSLESLRQIRDDTGYYGEIHFKCLGRNPWGRANRCARAWLNIYAKNLSSEHRFYCLGIDTLSPAFDSSRFGQPHHAYNRFARMCIENAVPWFLASLDRIELAFFSDAKSRKLGDNFETYLPAAVCESLAHKRKIKPSLYPTVCWHSHEVMCVESDPEKVDPYLKDECELIQLTDLLTSCIAQAATARSGRKGKVSLAEIVGRWIADVRKPPWIQTKELHRRFCVRCFPSDEGKFFDPNLKVEVEKTLPLFDKLRGNGGGTT